jgi:hypothetical protein
MRNHTAYQRVQTLTHHLHRAQQFAYLIVVIDLNIYR